MGRRQIGHLIHSPAWEALCGRPAARPASRHALCALLCGLLPAALKAQQSLLPVDLPEAPQAQSVTATQAPQDVGSIRGTILDRDGAMVTGARIALTQNVPGRSSTRDAISDEDGTFLFSGVPPGDFNLTVTAAGFSTNVTSGALSSGEDEQLSPITLHPGIASEVEVTLTRAEIAEDQIKVQEKQRVLGAIPNYYVSYVHNALPLTRKQKYELAWKTSIDPVSFGLTGIISGFQQADDDFVGYHQGAEGYAKRYGANYADLVAGTFIGGAVLPSILKQDPRYFYKGSGSVRSRFFYAVAMSVMCKGDNGRWQVNYSGILGGLAAGGISNLYYPDSDRNGAGLTFRNAAIGTGAAAVQNLFQEFLVRKLTPKLPKATPGPAPTAQHP